MNIPCGNVHRIGGGYGGSVLRAHFAPRWVSFTRSFPRDPLVDTNAGEAVGHLPVAGASRMACYRAQAPPVRTFKVSNDPRFAEKVIDVVGLYLDPPEHALVLSCDEKSQIQALDRTQPSLPIYPGPVRDVDA